jgi:hypothetical protein
MRQSISEDKPRAVKLLPSVVHGDQFEYRFESVIGTWLQPGADTLKRGLEVEAAPQFNS